MSSPPKTITISSDSSSSVQFLEEVTAAEALARSLPFLVVRVAPSPVQSGYEMTSSRDTLFSTREEMPHFSRSSLSECSLVSELSMLDLEEPEKPEEQPEEESSDEKEPPVKMPKKL